MSCGCQDEQEPALKMGTAKAPCAGPQSWMVGIQYTAVPNVSRFAYISGPMRGIKDFNFEAFYRAERLLLEAGWNTINPARIDDSCPGGTQLPLDTYVERDLEAIKALNALTDAVVTLAGARGEIPGAPGMGSKAEIAVAEWRGVPVMTVVSALQYRIGQPQTGSSGPQPPGQGMDTLALPKPNFGHRYGGPRGAELISDVRYQTITEDAKRQSAVVAAVAAAVTDEMRQAREARETYDRERFGPLGLPFDAALDEHRREKFASKRSDGLVNPYAPGGAFNTALEAEGLLPTLGFITSEDSRVAFGRKTSLPTTAEERKNIPVARGFLDYFPKAAAEVAKVSLEGGRQHGHGDDLYWERNKSADHADCAVRHLMERGTRDTDGLLHSAKAAWRVLAILELELEAAGAPIARGAK